MSSPIDPRLTEPAIGPLSAEAEALLGEQYLALWENAVHGARLDTAETFRRHATLFDPGALDSLRQSIAEAGENAGRRHELELLHAFLLSQQLAQRVRDLSDAAVNLDATGEVECDGRVLPYRQIAVEQSREADPRQRRLLNEAARPVLAKINVVLLERQRRTLEAAREMGLTGVVEVAGRVRQCDLRALAALGEQALRATESEYRALLDQVAPRETGLPRDRIRPCDLHYLIRGGRHERHFDARQLFPSLRGVLRGLSIDPDAQSGLMIDSGDRPGKWARAFCVPVRVPDDVRLSFRPSGGPFDFDCLYHEMGHAQHYLHTREPSFAFRCLGSAAVSETYALLFEGWTATVPWLRKITSMPDRSRKEFRSMRAFRLLYLVRRYSARLLYELGLHDGVLDGAREVYRRQQERALLVPLEEADADRYLADVDDLFYGVEYLRGWLLEVALERALRAKYGEGWFEHPGAGAYLMRLWERGGRPTAEELLQKIGAPGWSLETLLQRVRSLCTVT